VKRAKVTDGRPDWLVRLPDPWDEKVLAAAFDVFAAKGFDGATVNEIATNAGVSKRTIYERYQDKANIFRALLAWGCRQNLPDAQPSDDVDAEEALIAHGQTILSALSRPESVELARIVISAATRFPELGALFDDMTRTTSLDIVKGLCRRLVQTRRIRKTDPDVFSADFIGLLRGDHYQRALIGVRPPMSQEEVPEEARRVVGLLLKGLARTG
jgi:TetR/AcrR family transcriptional regulator, mexJK operon transcriptional repressor